MLGASASALRFSSGSTLLCADSFQCRMLLAMILVEPIAVWLRCKYWEISCCIRSPSVCRKSCSCWRSEITFCNGLSETPATRWMSELTSVTTWVVLSGSRRNCTASWRVSSRSASSVRGTGFAFEFSDASRGAGFVRVYIFCMGVPLPSLTGNQSELSIIDSLHFAFANEPGHCRGKGATKLANQCDNSTPGRERLFNLHAWSPPSYRWLLSPPASRCSAHKEWVSMATSRFDYPIEPMTLANMFGQ